MSFGANDREEIKKFLDEEFSAVESEGAVAAVVMVHHAHSGPVELHNMKTGHGKWGNADEMAHTFDSLATRHARGISGGGAQQYELTVARGSGGRPTAVLPFVRVGSPNIMGPSGSIATEPPTAMGQSMQSMRWGEQITQLTFTAIAHLQGSQQRALEQRDTKIENMERVNADLWLACKGLLLELDKRRHDEKMSELAAARMAEFQKQVMTLAPALINMMAGKEVFPLSAADTATLDTIAAMSSPEELRGLTALLAKKEGGPAIASALQDRFNSYHRRKANEAETEKRLLAELPSRTYEEAERDAAGDAIRALRGPSQNGQNGHGQNGSHKTALVHYESAQEGHDGASDPKQEGHEPDDTSLLKELVAHVPDGQLNMLTGLLAEADPDFAAKLEARLKLLKGSGK